MVDSAQFDLSKEFDCLLHKHLAQNNSFEWAWLWMSRYREPNKKAWSKGNNKVSWGISWTASLFQRFLNFASKTWRVRVCLTAQVKMMKVGKAEQDPGTTWQINHARKLSSIDSLENSIKMQLSFISFCSLSFLPPATGTGCVLDSLVFGTGLDILLRALFSS